MIIESNQISNFISDQFPKFYKDEGPNFILFMEAYYEWMEQTGNVIGDARSLLSYADIDSTLDKFLTHFSNKYLYGIPEKVKFDKRFLIKHVLDVYRSKGTIRGYKLLFKMLYNEDIDVYLPSKDLFATSDSDWFEPRFLEVTENDNNFTLVGNVVQGTSSNATAVVDSYIRQPVDNRIVHILYLTNLSGNFSRGEKLIADNQTRSSETISAAPTIKGSFGTLNIVQGGQNFRVGDTLVALTGSGIQAQALVTEVAEGTGTLNISIREEGSFYSEDAEEIITRTFNEGSQPSGQGASFNIGSISNVREVTYNNDIIFQNISSIDAFKGGVNSIEVQAQGSGYSNNIGNTLSFVSRFFVSNILVIDGGTGYSNGDTVTVTGGSIDSVGYIVTEDNGKISAIDVLEPGLWETNGSKISSINTETGAMANVHVELSPAGNGAEGYIVTDNSGHIVEARVSNTGIGYVVAPIVSVINPSGNGTILTANVISDYGFDPIIKSGLHSSIGSALHFTTKNFGSISSLTNIATGNNYNSEPNITVKDFIYSSSLPGKVYFSNTSNLITGSETNFHERFVSGDIIRLDTISGNTTFHEHRIVKSVTNATSMSLDDYPQRSANGNIAEVYILNGGNGYSNTDSVTVTGDGNGANVSIITNNTGTIVSYRLVSAGNGYSIAPSLVVVSNTGSNSSLYSTVSSSSYYYAANTISANFFGYVDLKKFGMSAEQTTEPGYDVSVSGSPIFGSGIIKNVRIKNSGFGYQEGEFITFGTFGSLQNLTIENGGRNYANGDVIVFDGGGPISFATGDISTDANGTIVVATLSNPGSGYKMKPSVRIVSRTGSGGLLNVEAEGINTTYLVSGYVGLPGSGRLNGYYSSTKGFASSDKYLQDSYYYQAFSYEIRSSIPFEEYSELVKKMYHTLGTEMFGRMIKTDYSISETKVDNLVQHQEGNYGHSN